MVLTFHKELLIHSYFNIVKREMIDMVPKAITLTLVNHSKENLQRELLQELYKPEVLDDLLKESEFVVTRRKEVMSMLSALNKAEECVLASFAFLFFSGFSDAGCTQDRRERVTAPLALFHRLCPPAGMIKISPSSRTFVFYTGLSSRGNERRV